MEMEIDEKVPGGVCVQVKADGGGNDDDDDDGGGGDGRGFHLADGANNRTMLCTPAVGRVGEERKGGG